MLTLILLRHAKSSWKDPALADHDRPLNTRGMAEAPVMGKAMAKHGLDPDVVLCSTARRTRDTLGFVLPELKIEPKVIYEDGLYHGTPAEMLGILHEVGAGVGQVLLVGHNPELQEFALDLIGSGAKHLKDRLEAKYPTAGLVVLRFPAAAWKSVAVNSGKLDLFLTPSDAKKS
ncbi:SixA phosphatase family protein [Methyloceanibacter sp.]|uniref:SixA phosphatase family protein n=1 Tax=Methyloceanibacter sp. TaxID=1965321 RepID=UPI003D6CD04D